MKGGCNWEGGRTECGAGAPSKFGKKPVRPHVVQGSSNERKCNDFHHEFSGVFVGVDLCRKILRIQYDHIDRALFQVVRVRNIRGHAVDGV